LPQILDNIRRSNYAKPRKFQQYALPLIKDGYDVKGQAETGSGKSAAFLLPIIHALMNSFAENPDDSRRKKISTLIIEPTRELAKQLYEQASKFAHSK
jgi:superfamily II DNA/RNA helicase